MIRLYALFLSVVFASISTQQLEAQEFRFTVVDASSWVARELNDYTVTPDDGWDFTASGSYGAALIFGLSGPAVPGTSVTNWGMTFEAPDSNPLSPGIYEDFQRFPFNQAGRPGLSFSSTGRLDNRAAGFFEVLDVTYAGGNSGEVTSFAADFTHFGEENTNSFSIVEFRFNATAVPEPSAVGVLFLAASTVVLRRKRS